ncbi:LOW QUALITY PROTEIN: leucine-rich PPR motif-containing protein, mitochondrial [Pseudochaenichthys georgianus]|uniref:LOW QUALITY PROTEIN: leucine-rich PPR motif-containing protein, mitochondrial n=1 Tax=Pseudochaenichthys georgianus TaxID=52239 RepID=UPI00146AAFD4|nr:LOW QUALITY PROTEIN: leucine-rich PPR motif-containing protein, mitochondrial [Pseudochaenichthys georgianus]
MSFHCATSENMAALLRSARLLKCSPLGLLQISCTKRTGPPFRLLFSGPLGARGTGVCSRHISPVSGNASSRVWPYTAGCVRNYALATEQKDEPGVTMRSNQAQQFDWALAKLDSSVRRTGRITETQLTRIFQDICKTGYSSGNQALLLLRSCGSLLSEVPLEQRTELAHRVWEKLQELGAVYDVSHYNALLKVYLQNEFKFTPTDFLAKMDAANVQPNRVTYQRLIAAYCQNGDIEGASTILGFMKSKDLPITEAVFNSLVTGHAQAGDIESAKTILTVMKGAGIEPGPDTYVALLNAYAEKGDLDNLKKTIEAAESAECSLMDRDLMPVIFTLAKAGHEEHIPHMVERLRHERGYVPDAMNLCLSLITQGLEDTAFYILKNFPNLQSDDYKNEANLGNFFLRHCVNIDMSLEKICSFCKELQESKLHAAPISFTLSVALETKKTAIALALMKMLKELDLPIRPHYFWPLLIHHVKGKNTAGVVEVLIAMQDLKIEPDSETLSHYVFPAFADIEEARRILKDAGLSLAPEGFFNSKIRSLAVYNLAELYILLSDPSCPATELSVFRGSLIFGFKKSSDVESMVKITELLSKDQRFSKEGTKASDTSSYFLYSFIDSMSEGEVHANEDKLRKYFNQLKDQNISVTLNIFRGIRNLLQSYEAQELIKDVVALVGHDGFGSDALRGTGAEGRVYALEKRSSPKGKQRTKPFGNILKQTIQSLVADENLVRALELKQEHEEEMVTPAYASLIGLCCRHDNVEEALNLKREMTRKDSSVKLDGTKYIALVQCLAKSDRIEEAVDFLKEMKEKEVVLNDKHITLFFHMLFSLATKGGAPTVQRLQDSMFTLGLVKPNSNLLSPLVSAYIESEDLSGALEAAMDCQKRYNHMPSIHRIVVALVEKGDTDLLQKAMDFVSQERGEMAMLYDLFFAFLQTGRYREARKIIETPGLRARAARIQWYAEKCINSNQIEPLEQMVDMTDKLFECDRDEMYSYLLRQYEATNEWKKAEGLWTKMQEENVIPRERTLLMLAKILKNNGQEVPFDVPETWYQEEAPPAKRAAPKVEEGPRSQGTSFQSPIIALCKNNKAQEALKICKEANDNGLAFNAIRYDYLIRSLLAEGSLNDAMAVKDIATSHLPTFQLSPAANDLYIITNSKKGQANDALERTRSLLQAGQTPSELAIIRLVQALGNSGNVSGIQEVQALISGHSKEVNLSSMIFVNNTAMAHIKSGDVESAIEALEAIYTNPDTQSQSMAFVFRKILEDNNEKALDKLSAMAERIANHFACYRPASDLFVQLLDADKVEDAKFMLARINALAEQTDVLVSYMSQKSQIPGQLGKIKTLQSLIPDFADKDVVNTYLMKCHVTDKDFSSAKALYEEWQKSGGEIDELSLKRLAMMYRGSGEMVPFEEPPESFRFYADQLKERRTQSEKKAET